MNRWAAKTKYDNYDLNSLAEITKKITKSYFSEYFGNNPSAHNKQGRYLRTDAAKKLFTEN